MFAFSGERRNLLRLWQDAWSLFKQEFRLLWPWALLLSLLSALTLYWSLFHHEPSVHPIANHMSVLPGISAHPPFENGVLIAVALLLLGNLVSVPIVSAIQLYFYLRGQGQQLQFKDAFQLIRERLPALYVTIILALLMTILGFFLLFIPGIILGVCWLTLPFIVILEKKTGFEAFRRSVSLVWGCWWYAACAYGVTSLLVSVFNGSIEMLPASFNWLIAVVITLFSVPTTLFLCAVVANVYHELLLRKAESS